MAHPYCCPEASLQKRACDVTEAHTESQGHTIIAAHKAGKPAVQASMSSDTSSRPHIFPAPLMPARQQQQAHLLAHSDGSHCGL